MTYQERKAKNPDYQICALKDSAFKGLAKNNKNINVIIKTDKNVKVKS